MKVKFLTDYIGRETAMIQYYKGDVADISTAQALELIKNEIAFEVEVEQIEVTSLSDEKPVFIEVIKKKVKHDKIAS